MSQRDPVISWALGITSHLERSLSEKMTQPPILSNSLWTQLLLFYPTVALAMLLICYATCTRDSFCQIHEGPSRAPSSHCRFHKQCHSVPLGPLCSAPCFCSARFHTLDNTEIRNSTFVIKSLFKILCRTKEEENTDREDKHTYTCLIPNSRQSFHSQFLGILCEYIFSLSKFYVEYVNHFIHKTTYHSSPRASKWWNNKSWGGLLTNSRGCSAACRGWGAQIRHVGHTRCFSLLHNAWLWHRHLAATVGVPVGPLPCPPALLCTPRALLLGSQRLCAASAPAYISL